MKIQIALTLLWLFLILLFANLAREFYFSYPSSLQEISYLLLLSLQVSFSACLWVFILTEDPMLFSWIKSLFYHLAERFYFVDGKIDQQRFIITEYLMKPFFTCEICTGGNFAFWVYIISHTQRFVLMDFIFVFAVTTLITISSKKLWKK